MARAPNPNDPRDVQAAVDRRINAQAFAAAVKEELAKFNRATNPGAAVAEAAKARQETADKLSGVVSSLRMIASGMGSPTGAVSGLGSGLGMAIGGPAGTMVSAVAQLPALFKAGADSVSNFVSAFAPALGARYSQAWADLSASIGEQLLPVLEMATGVVRFFGDIVAGLTPIIRPVVDQLSRIYSAFGGALQDVFNEFIKSFIILDSVFAPFRELMIDLATGPLQLLTWGLKQLAEWLKVATNQLAIFFGVEVPKIEGASMGKAATSVTTTTTDGLLRSLREKAFALGKSGGEDPAAKSANLLQQIFTWLVNELPSRLMTLAIYVREMVIKEVNTVLQKILKVLDPTGEKVTGALSAGVDATFKAMQMLNNLRAVVPGVPTFAGP